MRPIPAKKVRSLIKQLAEAAEDAPALGFRFEIDGVYGLDKGGDLGLAAALEEDLPVEIPVDGKVTSELKRRWSSMGAGGWRLEIWRHPPGTSAADGLVSTAHGYLVS